MDRKLARVRELQIHIYAFRNGVVDMLRVLYLGNFTTILLVVVTSLMQSGIPAIIIIILTMVQSYADDTHYPPAPRLLCVLPGVLVPVLVECGYYRRSTFPRATAKGAKGPNFVSRTTVG
jgi:hypothetical protein